MYTYIQNIQINAFTAEKKSNLSLSINKLYMQKLGIHYVDKHHAIQNTTGFVYFGFQFGICVSTWHTALNVHGPLNPIKQTNKQTKTIAHE